MMTNAAMRQAGTQPGPARSGGRGRFAASRQQHAGSGCSSVCRSGVGKKTPPAKMTYIKDGQQFQITEEMLPPEDLQLWEETGKEVASTALWDLLQTSEAADGFPAMDTPSPESRAATAAVSRQRLQISKMDFTVNSIIDKINRGKVNLRPSYQREYVWTTRTASRLIESLLLNVPIPTMFFHETEGGNMEVVDGKQRLTSVWAFMMGEFPDGTPFKLTGLEVYEDLNGLTFRDLTEQQQETIKDYPLNVHTISKQSQPDFVFEVFERLNMGATQLNEQELRNCIYQGAYTELLGRLAANNHLLSIYKSSAPHLRMRDRELILRFFAMLKTSPDGFRSPVKAWLNEEIRLNRDLPAAEVARLKLCFEATIYQAWEIFGECAFRPVKPREEWTDNGAGRFETGEVNVALWDTVMFSLAQYQPEQLLPYKDAVREAFVGLAGDVKFRKLLVSQPKAVVARAEAWGKVLSRVLSS